MKVIKNILLIFLLVFVVAQFFRPEKNLGAYSSIDFFLEETSPSDEVKTILKESCYDCHSDYTKYPWYSNITPVNFWLANHIKAGKKHFNVSNWEGNSLDRKDHKIEELIEEVEEKKMPLTSYTLTHSQAKLSDKQIKSIIDWAKLVRIKYALLPKAE